MRIFVLPFTVALLAGIAAFFLGGLEALSLVALLAVLEITLSFDNAVVNAKVLKRMSEVWQRRFMTWGIPIAVFGTRFILPIVIVAAAAGLSPFFVLHLALFDPTQYAEHVHGAHVAIAAFGSAFLLMVSLRYFVDREKTVHWIKSVERHLSRWGGIDALEIAITLSALLMAALLTPEPGTVLVAGLIGVIAFIVIGGIAQSFEMNTKSGAALGGAATFLYLEVLDAAFSLDGVVGAFAITSSVIQIITGLAIGALFVRAFTVSLVRAHTLDSLVYLEHGAHWAIFGLALSMLMSIFMHVPETVTGLIGITFIGFSYLSSRAELKNI